MPDVKRTDRIAEEIRKQLTLLLSKEIDDPNIPKLLTITAVHITQDLSNATIYFTAFSSEPTSEIEFALNKIAPYLRSLLGKAMLIRRLPELKFRYDDSVEYAKNLSKLIDSLDQNSDN